jgi:stage V sporulation protein B
MILAISGPFLYLSQTVTGMLQGLGKPSIPFKNLLISSVIKLGGIYFLTSLSFLQIKGAALSLCVSYIIMSCLNYLDLKKITGVQPDISMCFIKPAVAATACGVIMWQIKLFMLSAGLPAWLSLLATLGAGGISYLAVLYIIKGLHNNDLDKISRIINKAHR